MQSDNPSPLSFKELMEVVGKAKEKERKLAYCVAQRSGKGCFTRKLVSKDERRKKRRARRAAQKKQRGRS